MCAHNASGHMVLVVRPYVHHVYIYSDKPTSEQEEIKVSPPNLSLRSPINLILTFQEGEWDH